MPPPQGAYVILPDRLVYTVVPAGERLTKDDSCLYYTSDEDLVYEQFFADYGPLNLGNLHRYVTAIDALLAEAESAGKTVVHYSSSHGHRRSNAVLLACSYSIIRLNRSVPEAYRPFMGIQPPLMPYRDAAFAICTFSISVLDCLKGLKRALDLGHFDMETFDVDKFFHLDRIENGDVSWIIPGKFIAFSGPLARKREIEAGVFTMAAEEYVPLMKSLGVTAIVRFNKKCYERKHFTDAGIHHFDLYYEDGGNPTEEIMQKFIRICENEKGAIAVHCKAGLGRTGTNIAAYMMKHYGYTAVEATAWLRLSRPGSVVGPQQHFVVEAQARLWKEGDLMRQKKKRDDRRPSMDQKPRISLPVSRPSPQASESPLRRRASNGGRSTPRTLAPLASESADEPPRSRPSSSNASRGAQQAARGTRRELQQQPPQQQARGSARPHTSESSRRALSGAHASSPAVSGKEAKKRDSAKTKNYSAAAATGGSVPRASRLSHQ